MQRAAALTHTMDHRRRRLLSPESRVVIDPARGPKPFAPTFDLRAESPPVEVEDGVGSAESEEIPRPTTPTPAETELAEDLGDEIATLAAHIHAGTQRLLVLIARFDRLGGWIAGGHKTCAHWLSFRTGLDLGTAREHVRVARALEELPETSTAMAEGRLAFSQVRALTRVAEPESEGDLLELAEGCTTAQLERLVRAWKKCPRTDELDLERERHRARSLSVFPDDDGMYAISGRLDPEVGALLIRAVEAATDALYRQDRRSSDTTMPGPRAEREAGRRRADAIGLLAERALAAGFGDPASSKATDSEPEGGAPISESRAARYQVVLYVDEQTVQADAEPGRSELEDGTRVSAETSRRLSCDASLVRVRKSADGPNGSALDIGRRTRTISPALRRALDARDRGCRFPGCGLRFTDAHHVIHWADGGETSLANTVLLCRFHHRLVHEEGWTVEWWGASRQPAFRDPGGSVHVAGGAPRPELPLRPDKSLQRRNESLGVLPDAWTASARWEREADIPDDVLFRAMEAAM